MKIHKELKCTMNYAAIASTYFGFLFLVDLTGRALTPAGFNMSGDHLENISLVIIGPFRRLVGCGDFTESDSSFGA